MLCIPFPGAMLCVPFPAAPSVTAQAGQPVHVGVVCSNHHPGSRHARGEDHPTALAVCHPAGPVIHCFCSDLPGVSELIAT